MNDNIINFLASVIVFIIVGIPFGVWAFVGIYSILKGNEHQMLYSVIFSLTTAIIAYAIVSKER